MARVAARVVHGGRRAFALDAEAQRAEHVRAAVDLHTVCLRCSTVAIAVVGRWTAGVNLGRLVLLVNRVVAIGIARQVAVAIIAIVGDDVAQRTSDEFVVEVVAVCRADPVHSRGELIARPVVGVAIIAALYPATRFGEGIGQAVERVVAVCGDVAAHNSDLRYNWHKESVPETRGGCQPQERL